jgi:hypothetical protein
MKKWKITEEWIYTITKIVEAETEEEAFELSDDMDGEENNDDHFYDRIAEEMEDKI